MVLTELLGNSSRASTKQFRDVILLLNVNNRETRIKESYLLYDVRPDICRWDRIAVAKSAPSYEVSRM